jgi:hypothetical protein
MASSCRIFREELLARPVSLLLGALGGSRDPARATSLWTATLGRGSRWQPNPTDSPISFGTLLFTRTLLSGRRTA